MLNWAVFFGRPQHTKPLSVQNHFKRWYLRWTFLFSRGNLKICTWEQGWTFIEWNPRSSAREFLTFLPKCNENHVQCKTKTCVGDFYFILSIYWSFRFKMKVFLTFTFWWQNKYRFNLCKNLSPQESRVECIAMLAERNSYSLWSNHIFENMIRYISRTNVYFYAQGG